MLQREFPDLRSADKLSVRIGLWAVFIFSIAVTSSQGQRSSTAASAPEKIPLEEVSSVPVPSLPAESIADLVFCDGDGRIVFRLAMPDTGVKDPVSVSSDGKTVIQFGKDRMNDIPRPNPLSMFLGGSEVYILTLGSVPLGYTTNWRI